VKTYEITYTETIVGTAFIGAKNKTEAKLKFNDGDYEDADGGEVTEVEILNIEVSP